MNDAQLVSLATRGDRSAFEAIVERYKSLVCAITYGATGDYAASEDLAQETFVAAWLNLSRLDKPERLRSWLCSVARHISFSALRKRRRETEHTKVLQQASQAAEQSCETPRDAATLHEEQKLVWQIVEKVPEAYRVPLILYYREGHSVERVAAATGLSESAVKQRLLRGRRMLKDEMAALVENSLAGSRPDKKFTAGVIAALPPAAAMSVPAGRPVQTPSGAISSVAQEVFAAWGAKQVALSTIAVLAVLGITIVGTGAIFGGPAPEKAAITIEASAGPSLPREEPRALAEVLGTPEMPAAIETSEPSPPPSPGKTEPAPGALVPGRVVAPAGYPGTEMDEKAVDTVMGTVYAPNGGALPKAKVWAARFAMQARDTRETVADEDGRYSLVVPPGQWMVSARLGRFGGESDAAPHGQIITNGENREIPANIPTEERCIVHGRVYDNTTGKPVSHPQLWTSSRLLVGGDNEGFYEIEGQDHAYQTLAVLCPGYARKYIIYSTLLRDDFELDLSVEPGVRVSGRVVDKEGRGLANAWVCAAGSGRGVLSAYYEVCDQYGRFVYDGLPRGKEITLTAEQPRFIQTCWEPEPVEGKETARKKFVARAAPGTAAENITFTLDPVDRQEIREIRDWPDDPPCGVMRGRLVAWDGHPLRNFQIITRTVSRDSGLPTPFGMEINEFFRGYSFTNDEGVFTLASPSFAPGEYLQLIAMASGYLDGVAEPVLAYPAEDLGRVPETLFRLGVPKALKVRVTEADAGGAPIQGAKVVVQDITADYMTQPFDWREMDSPMWRPVSATTGAAGWAELESINHEKGIVLASHPDYGRTRTVWDGNDRQLELTMEREAAVDGVATDEKGGVPPQLAVRLSWCAAPPYLYQDFERSSQTYWDASPGDGGHFYFDQLPPGYYMLRSWYWPGAKYDHTNQVQYDMEFFLEPGQAMSVRLPEESIQDNPDGWVAAGGLNSEDRRLTEKVAGAWENHYTVSALGRQGHIVLLFYENGRYEQTVFGEGADRAIEDSGYYRVIDGRLERITDRGGTLSESVEFDGEAFFLHTEGDPYPDHPGRGPFRPVDDVAKSLRRGEFLLKPRPRIQASEEPSEAPASGRSGFSRSPEE
ncbi:MAG TPA: sigma-70 family RNA polymerase sigma factor [Candidatus Hydrogenedentes bacterium]|nr:sigma-70 family RNA polymerase sigma factor [Candidatus Hydrogenedentota bacterium]